MIAVYSAHPPNALLLAAFTFFRSSRMAFPALIGVAVSTLGSNPSLLSGLANNPKDQARFNEAKGWYSQAIQGDAEALCALKHMSGRFGVSGPNCKGVARSGYATQEAKDYSYTLYQQAEAVLNGQASPGTPIPLDPDAKPGSQVGQVLQGVSTVTGQAASGLGFPSRQEQERNLAIVLGIGALVLVLGFTAFALRRR